MNDKFSIRAALVVSIVLLALLYCGHFFPSSLNWGFHFLGFLPLPIVIAFVVVGIAAVVLAYLGYIEKMLMLLAEAMQQRQILFLSMSCAVFVILATLLRIRVPLLGDSFILLNNYEFTFAGYHTLHLFRSPLAFGYFYVFAYLLHAPAYPAIMDAFLVGELVLGIIFIICTFFITKILFEKPEERLFTFLFLLALPYMEIFFGYAELYSVVLTTLAVFLLVSLLHLKGKAPYYLLPPAYLLLYLANYLNIILLPALLFSTYLEIKFSKKWTIAAGIGLALLVYVVALWFVHFDVERFMQAEEGGHWLSFAKAHADQFQAYTMFSPFHLSELGNIFILLASGGIFFVVYAAFNINFSHFLNETTAYLITATMLFFGFIAVVKLDLGFPNDWDVTSSYFFLVNLFALVIFFQVSSPWKIRIASIVGIAVVLLSLSWLIVNSTIDAPLRRAEKLLDSRIISNSGIFQSMFHISMYYHHDNFHDKEVPVWQQYNRMYPWDKRGVQNIAKAGFEAGESYDSISTAAFERWMSLDSVTWQPEIEYGNFLSERGLQNYVRKNFNAAERLLRKATEVNPYLTPAYNNLASLYLDTQRPDSTIVCCLRALEKDPEYTLAYQNLANAFAQQLRFDMALKYYNKVLELEPSNYLAYENMSRVYYRLGDRNKAIDLLKQAARLGSKTAQSLLSGSGQTWE